MTSRTPPAWMRKLETVVLMEVFARAFDVEAPNIRRLDAENALWTFREFTAVCMQTALVNHEAAEEYRTRLGTNAYRLGTLVARLLRIRASRAISAARFFYRGILIDLDGNLPGRLQFSRCYFAERYTPEICWFMSAFDEGFMRGISGIEDARLEFSCRLTKGCACCCARFE